MSEHRFVCPCGQHLSCDDSMIGKKIACPTCGAMLQLGEKPAHPRFIPDSLKVCSTQANRDKTCKNNRKMKKTESVRILRHQAEFKLEKARQTGDMSAVERQKAILAALKNGSPPPEDNTESKPTIRVVRRKENGKYNPVIYRPRKSIVAFILLGFFFGGLGIHNFYAGYKSDGMKQLLISLLSPLILWLLFGFFIGSIIHLFVTLAIFIWVIIDLISKNCDANGVEMV